jgi:membrane protein implicated in regulation of membrane protease activity
MLIFICITVAGLILLIGGSLFGHDHDAGGHDGHLDAGHDVAGDAEPTVSIFSLKVIGTFIMGFGAGGAIAVQYGADPLAASAVGLASGVLIGLLMYLVMRLIYGQQSTSIIATESAVGHVGTVTVSIASDGLGEVDLDLHGQHRSFLARAAAPITIARGRQVTVVRTVGSQLVVEELVADAQQPVAAPVSTQPSPSA